MTEGNGSSHTPSAEVAKLGPLLSPTLRDQITALIPRYPTKQAVTLPALHLVHEAFRCVPYQAIREIAELLDLAPAEVHDTMSFYLFFPQAPIGNVRMWVCRSISCALRGGESVLDQVCERLKVHPGETTSDGQVTVEFAECLGLCDHAPAALLDDGRIFGPVEDDAALQRLIDAAQQGPRSPELVTSSSVPAGE